MGQEYNLSKPMVDSSAKNQIKEGRVEIIKDSRIDTLMKKLVKINESKGTIEGYRVQIHIASGSHSKKKSQDVREAFIKKYSENEVYIIYQAPNFKVRVGDFRTRLDASGLLQELKNDYPGAFIVKDEINLPGL